MYQPPQQYVTKRGANHTLHIVLTICTCGMWAITGWPIAAIMGRKTKTTAYPAAGYLPPGPQWQQPPTYHYPPPQQPPAGPTYPPQPQQPPGQYGPPRP